MIKEPRIFDEGDPYLYGATITKQGVNFSLFSAGAEKVEVCLFDAQNREYKRIALPYCTNQHWHVRIEGLAPTDTYGYRVYGPWEPAKGLKFNPHKLLIDPRSSKWNRAVVWHPAIFGYQKLEGKSFSLEDQQKSLLKMSLTDSAPYVPKAYILPTKDYTAKAFKKIPWESSIVYELHVKGFSQLNPDIPLPSKGKISALKHSSSLRYLKNLGVTTLELLPISAFLNEERIVEKGLTNYWGYNPLSFFAMQPDYYENDGFLELKSTTEMLHEHGFEVILDLVFNHTAESDEFGPQLCFRGIDNASYYLLDPKNPLLYLNHSGCGNCLDLTNPVVARLVLDSLIEWAELGVDGFRFDLAPALGRTAQGFDPKSPLLSIITHEPKLRGLKLIAEPWDFSGIYQGQFPTGFQEWTGDFKTRVFACALGLQHSLPRVADVLAGSNKLFPFQSLFDKRPVNYLATHDGFTLLDRLSYTEKQNWPNQEENRDGEGAELNWNSGKEGAAEDLVAIRLQWMKALNMLLFFAQGIPMLTMGEERGQTHLGNSNPYVFDTELNWLPWYSSNAYSSFTPFISQLINLRKQAAGFFALEQPGKEFRQIEWFQFNGEPMNIEAWQQQKLGALSVLYRLRNKAMLLAFNFEPTEKIFHFPLLGGLSEGNWQLKAYSIYTPELESVATANESAFTFPNTSAFWWVLA